MEVGTNLLGILKFGGYVDIRRDDYPLAYMNIRSEGLEGAAAEIRTMKIVMYTVSILLTVLGVFNYLNFTA